MLCWAVRGEELKTLFDLNCLGVNYCIYSVYCNAQLLVFWFSLFSSHHLGGITKGCSNNYDSESLPLYSHLLTLTQLYSNLVYNEHDTTYLCLVLVVLVSPKISRVRLALLCTLLVSIIFVWSASYHIIIIISINIMHSLAKDSLILISENKGGPTPGH